jgi:hypothetical protein
MSIERRLWLAYSMLAAMAGQTKSVIISTTTPHTMANA